MQNQNNKIAAYLQAERDLMRRYDDLKYGRFIADTQTSQLFAPIITPLEELNRKVKNNQYVDIPLGMISSKNVKVEEEEDMKLNDFDSQFGIYKNDDNYMIGNQVVQLYSDKLILQDGTKYTMTPGLYKLLTDYNDKQSTYEEEDLKNYQAIIIATSSHREDNNEKSYKFKYGKGEKYKNVIKPL